jgi:serine/threonine protein kinase
MLSSEHRAKFISALRDLLTVASPAKQYLDGLTLQIVKNSELHRVICEQANPNTIAQFRQQYKSNENTATKETWNPIRVVKQVLPDTLFSRTGSFFSKKTNPAKGDYDLSIKQVEACFAENKEVDPGVILQLLKIYIMFADAKFPEAIYEYNILNSKLFLVLPIAVGNPLRTKNKLRIAIPIIIHENKIIYDFEVLYKLKVIAHKEGIAEPKPNWHITRQLYPDDRTKPATNYFYNCRPVSFFEVQKKGICFDETIYFMLSPFIVGSTLQHFIENPAIKLEPSSCLELMFKFIVEVYCLQACGYLFNDVKPLNVLLGNYSNPNNMFITLLDLEQTKTICLDSHQNMLAGTTLAFASPRKGTTRAIASETTQYQAKQQESLKLIKKHAEKIASIKVRLQNITIDIISSLINSPTAKSDIFGIGMIFLHLILKMLNTTFKDFLTKEQLFDKWENYVHFKNNALHVQDKEKFIKDLRMKINTLTNQSGEIISSLINLTLNMITTSHTSRYNIIETLESLLNIIENKQLAAIDFSTINFNVETRTPYSTKDILAAAQADGNKEVV